MQLSGSIFRKGHPLELPHVLFVMFLIVFELIPYCLSWFRGMILVMLLSVPGHCYAVLFPLSDNNMIPAFVKFYYFC